MAFVIAAALAGLAIASPVAEPAVTSSSADLVTHAPATAISSRTGAWTFSPTTFPPIQPGLYPHNSKPVIPTSAPAVREKRAPSQFAVYLENRLGASLSVSYQGNAGAPSAVYGGTPGAVPSGGATYVAYPSGWAGRIYVQYGGKYVGYDHGNTPIPVDPRASKIEGSLMNNALDVDISYVDGFSVPASCYCNGNRVSGCSTNLWGSSKCPPNQVSANDFVCYNPQQNVPCGPATQFFAPCQGHAYTYPDDDQANSSGECTGTIVCCADTIAGDAGCPTDPDSGHLKFGSSPNPQCGGSGVTNKRDVAVRGPVDPAEGHWYYNSTLFTNFQAKMRELGLEEEVIPDHIFKK